MQTDGVSSEATRVPAFVKTRRVFTLLFVVLGLVATVGGPMAASAAAMPQPARSK